ncbi:MAG: class D sortase [Acidimicrobiales bacterium]
MAPFEAPDPGSFLGARASAMKALGIARSVLGTALLGASAAGASYAAAWTIRSHEAAARDMAHGSASLSTSKTYDAQTSCTAAKSSTGQLAGFLQIPSLSLRAPVEQGETGAVLSAAVGHDLSSVWPGQDGTAVLAAHDVSYFARIGTLKRGSTVVYVSPCRTVTFRVTGHRIVAAGSPVANSPGPTLVLDTCWPNNALWWTPDRELVTAVEVNSRPTTAQSTRPTAQATGALRWQSTPLAVPAPPSLVDQGLTLDTNPTMLGTMSVTGTPSSSFVQSPLPLAVEQAGLTAYYGTLHAVMAGRPDWFAAVAPKVSFPAALSGARISLYLSRLTVAVEAKGNRPVGAVLSASVELTTPAGAVSDGTLVVSCAVRHGELLVTGWHF